MLVHPYPSSSPIPSKPNTTSAFSASTVTTALQTAVRLIFYFVYATIHPGMSISENSPSPIRGNFIPVSGPLSRSSPPPRQRTDLGLHLHLNLTGAQMEELASACVDPFPSNPSSHRTMLWLTRLLAGCRATTRPKRAAVAITDRTSQRRSISESHPPTPLWRLKSLAEGMSPRDRTTPLDHAARRVIVLVDASTPPATLSTLEPVPRAPVPLRSDLDLLKRPLPSPTRPPLAPTYPTAGTRHVQAPSM